MIMNNILKSLGVSFILNVVIGLYFIIFSDSILQRTDLAIIIGIGSVLISSISFVVGTFAYYFYRLYMIKRERNKNQNS